MKCAAALALLTGASAVDQSPIQKVVTLVRDMKDQTTKEGEQDLAAYDKYKCWCETTTTEKTAAIDAATTKLEELNSFVEEAAAKEGELKTEIEGLEADIAADTDALQTATALRTEENGKFEASAADMKETIGLLTEAVDILGKVQLFQKQGATKEAFVQVQKIVKRVSPKFSSVMQKDLFDMLGEFKGLDEVREKAFGKALATGSFLGEVFLPKREAAVLAQSMELPWIKSEEQIGAEAKPNQQVGAAA